MGATGIITLKNLSLKNKIFLATTAVILLISVVIALFTRWVLISSLTSELKRRGLGIANSIAESGRGHILTADIPELTSLLFDARLHERRMTHGEEAEEKDYLGIFSVVLLSYLLVPFQAYASVKGFLQKEEGPWFRTPKTGKITDIFRRGTFYRWISGILPRWSGSRLAASIASQAIPAWVKFTPGVSADFTLRVFLSRFSKSTGKIAFCHILPAKLAIFFQICNYGANTE